MADRPVVVPIPTRGRPRRRPPPPPIKVLGKTLPRGTSAAVRASPWAFGGAVMIELENAMFGWMEEWQLRSIEEQLKEADAAAKRRLEQRRSADPVEEARDRRERQSRAAEQRIWENQYGAWEPSPAAVPPPRTGDYYVEAPPRAVPRVDLPGPLDRPPIVPAAPVTVPIPPPTAKQKILAAANRAMQFSLNHPLLSAVLVGGLVSLAPKSRGRSAPAPEEFEEFEEGLTDFGPSPLISGTTGGVPVELSASEFAEEVDPESDFGGECEEINPPRPPGECRQGWFSETPSTLELREWSRRPCR